MLGVRRDTGGEWWSGQEERFVRNVMMFHLNDIFCEKEEGDNDNE